MMAKRNRLTTFVIAPFLALAFFVGWLLLWTDEKVPSKKKAQIAHLTVK